MDRALLALGLAALSACDARRESVTERARHAADPRPQATAGAGGTDGAPHPGADAGSAGTPEPEADPRFAAHLDDPADFARLQGEQWSVKYLARIDGRQPPEPTERECTFQDTAAYPLHLDFLRTFAGLGTLDFNTYLTLVVHRASRVLWGGELRLFSGARHPRTGKPGVMGLFVYADDEEPLGTEQLVEIVRRIEGCAPYARDMLVLVGADTEQASRLREQADDLDDAGISVVDVVDLVSPDVAAEGYSVGDGYGYLRIVRSGQKLPSDLGPRDLLVIEGASDDIGLVAGVVSSLPQNVHSHLNLRLREKAIPNARIADVFEDQSLMELDGRLGHLHVEAETALLEPALLVDAEAFWSMRVPPITLPTPDLGQRSLGSVAHLSAADVSAYGTKATNLGELYAALPKANRLTGFGIVTAPSARRWLKLAGSRDKWSACCRYRAFMSSSRFPPRVTGGLCSDDFSQLIHSLYDLDWNVYSKAPFAGPKYIFRYLAHYTHRTGISNSRRVAMDEQGGHLPHPRRRHGHPPARAVHRTLPDPRLAPWFREDPPLWLDGQRPCCQAAQAGSTVAGHSHRAG